MQETQGLVMKITDRFLVVVCDDGKFRNLPLSEKIPGLGERITVPLYRKKRLFSFSRVSAAAACFALLAGLAFWFQTSPRYDQVIAIDINPSLELFVDSKERVVKAKPLNPDGEKVLDHFPVGKISLQDAIAEVLTKSASLGYIQKDKENIILIAAAKSKRGASLNSDLIEATVKTTLQSLHLNGFVKVQMTDESVYNQSKAENLSLNKWLLLQQAARLGSPINVEKAAGESVLQLLQEAGIIKEPFFAPIRISDRQQASGQLKTETLPGQNSDKGDPDTQKTETAGTSSNPPASTSSSPAEGISPSTNPANQENSQLQQSSQPQMQTQSPTPTPSRNPNPDSPQDQPQDTAGSSGTPETSGVTGPGPGAFGSSPAPEASESPVSPASTKGPDAANTSDSSGSTGSPRSPGASEASGSPSAPAAPAPSGAADSSGTPSTSGPPAPSGAADSSGTPTTFGPPAQDSGHSAPAPSTGADSAPGNPPQQPSNSGTQTPPDPAAPAPSNTNRR